MTDERRAPHVSTRARVLTFHLAPGWSDASLLSYSGNREARDSICGLRDAVRCSSRTSAPPSLASRVFTELLSWGNLPFPPPPWRAVGVMFA